MVAVQTLCRHAFWLDTGQLKAPGAVSEIVTAYLRGGLGRNGTNERVLAGDATAPGNDTVRLQVHRRPTRRRQDGRCDHHADIAAREVEYWNLLPESISTPRSTFTTTRGSSRSRPVSRRSRIRTLHVQPRSGRYRSVCHIPGELSQQRVSRVSLLLVRGNWLPLTRRMRR